MAALLACIAPVAAAGRASPSVEACVKAAGNNARALEGCIGKVSAACIGPDEASKPSHAIRACFDTEQGQWDGLLNAAYQALQKGLDPEQQVKLRDMQRSWIETRTKTCDFYYDYFQGTMANPMIANCLNRETARRAIFLRGFAEDMAGWKK